MDVPEGNIRATKITAENLNIDLEEHQTGGLLKPETSKLKIYNQATLPQRIQYWLLVGLSIGSLISYGATVISSLGIASPQCNCTALISTLPK